MSKLYELGLSGNPELIKEMYLEYIKEVSN